MSDGVESITSLSVDGIGELRQGLAFAQRVCRAGSIAKGFGAEGDAVREWAAKHKDSDEFDGDFAQARLTDYYAKRVALIVTEPVEAFEEVRSGKVAINQTYYPTSHDGFTSITFEEDQPAALDPSGAPPVFGTRHKPEGVLSELADTVIRCFDFAEEIEGDLAAAIIEKLLFNATRPAMHGRKF